jgi:uncharacterized membrane protein YbhN (UPF0104 family)
VNRKLLQVAKSTWAILVFVVAGRYLYARSDLISASVAALSPAQIAVSILFVFGGKIVLVEVVRRSVDASGSRFSRKDIAFMTMTSQLAKYLPGGVWHLVGRIGMYGSRGMNVRQSSKAVLLEQTWLLASATCFGGIVVGAGARMAVPPLTWAPAGFMSYVAIVALGLAWWAALTISYHVLAVPGERRRWYQWVSALGEQALVWGLMGLSLWILIPQAGTLPGALTAIGAFGIAWTVGYLAVFAPGGLGVREAVLVMILGLVVRSENAAIAAAVHRAVWTLSELVLGGAAWVFLREPRASDGKTKRAIAPHL